MQGCCAFITLKAILGRVQAQCNVNEVFFFHYLDIVSSVVLSQAQQKIFKLITRQYKARQLKYWYHFSMIIYQIKSVFIQGKKKQTNRKTEYICRDGCSKTHWNASWCRRTCECICKCKCIPTCTYKHSSLQKWFRDCWYIYPNTVTSQ